VESVARDLLELVCNLEIESGVRYRLGWSHQRFACRRSNIKNYNRARVRRYYPLAMCGAQHPRARSRLEFPRFGLRQSKRSSQHPNNIALSLSIQLLQATLTRRGLGGFARASPSDAFTRIENPSFRRYKDPCYFSLARVTWRKPATILVDQAPGERTSFDASTADLVSHPVLAQLALSLIPHRSIQDRLMLAGVAEGFVTNLTDVNRVREQRIRRRPRKRSST
jgi:hypothetical protein